MAEDRYRQGLVIFLLIGAALRLVGLNWDEGRGLHPDEGNLVRAALQLSFPDALIPSFHAYNDLALWLPRLLAVPVCDAGDAACLTLSARLVSVCFAVAAVPLGAGLARATAGPVAGLVAAGLFATSAPLIQWAHFGTTESALIFILLAVWLTTARWVEGRTRSGPTAVICGLLIGIGFGFKTTALAFAVVPLAAMVLAQGPVSLRVKAIAIGAVTAALTSAVAAPSIWAASASWLDVMRFERDVVQGARSVFWTAQFEGTGSVTYQLRQICALLAGAGALLALIGVGVLCAKGSSQARRIVLPGVVFTLVYAALTFGWHAKFVRYLAPLIPVMLILAAIGAARLLAITRSRTGPAFALVAVGLMALVGLDQTAGYLRTDPRLAAERLLTRQASPGDVVAIEPHDLAQTGGKERMVLPLTDPDLDPDKLAPLLAQADWLMIASRRNWSVLPHGGGARTQTCTFYAALAEGKLGYHSHRRFDRRGPFGVLFAPGTGAEETRAVFDRPDVVLMRNADRLSAETIAAAMEHAASPEACTPARLAEGFGL